MRAGPHTDVEIAVRPAAQPDTAAARQPQHGAGVHAGRHVERVDALAPYPPLAPAGPAGVLDVLPQTSAPPARARRHHLAQQRLAHLAHLAGARAVDTGHRLGTGSGTRGLAVLAGHRQGHGHLLGTPEDGVDEIEWQDGLDVGTGGGCAAARRPEATEPPVAEERRENVERVRRSLRRPEAVEIGTPLGIAQHLVGGGHLLEALLGGRVIGVAVGMGIARQPPVRLLDLLRGGPGGDTQNLVVVATRHGDRGRGSA